MKTAYVTWHYTTHGIAFLKHVLSEFYLLGKIPDQISLDGLNQSELNKVFDKPKREGGFLFDEVIYITATQRAHDKISSRRFSHKYSVLEDPVLKKSPISQIYAEIVDKFPEHNLNDEIQFLSENYQKLLPEYYKILWRNIQHYPITEQIKWLKEFSNFNKVYADRLKVVELDLYDLRDEKLIADKVGEWSRDHFAKHTDTQYMINVALGSSETQVVWHIFSESGQLPNGTRFVKTYDDKNNNPEDRFKNFAIKEVPTNLITTISTDFPVFTKTKSPSRLLVQKKVNFFLDSGFSILMLGERGTGKSRLIREAREELSRRPKSEENRMPFVEVNCASFLNDQIALTELFGYDKGTFTDQQKEGKKGLLEEANGGICFLDEMHHLSIVVQAQLMKAFQTDKKNYMYIRRVGSNKEIPIRVKLIFATNKTVDELKDPELILPDFYDRIVQHVVSIPPLRETVEDRVVDWNSIWQQLNFRGNPTPPAEFELVSWLRRQPFYGNYRDLQKVAMYYNIFNEFDTETKKMVNVNSAFSYAKAEFEKYHSANTVTVRNKFNFNESQTTKELIADYCDELQEWSVRRFGGRKAAIEHFKSLGDTVTEGTFYDWKTKNSLKKKS